MGLTKGSLAFTPKRPKRAIPTGQKPSITKPKGSGLTCGKLSKSSPGSSGLTKAKVNPISLSVLMCATLATLQKGPAMISRFSLLSKSSICQAALHTNCVAPLRHIWSIRRFILFSSSGQITGGSHQQTRGTMVRESSPALGESQSAICPPLAPRVSRPWGNAERSVKSGRLFSRRAGSNTGLVRTAALGRPLCLSSLLCHVLRICTSSGSRLSIKNTDVPAFGVLCFGTRKASVPALGTRLLTESVV